MATKSKQRRLINLFKANPHCFWCSCLVMLENRHERYKKHPPHMATLDHIISHNNKNWEKGMRNRIVLSCTECNNKRQAKETRMLPIEELWHQSGRYPVHIQEKK